MKNESCVLLSWVIVLLLLLINSEPTVAPDVYRNNEYEVSEIDKRIAIPKPDLFPYKHQHTGFKRQQINLLEQSARKHQHPPNIKRHPTNLAEHQARIHARPSHRQSQHVGLRRQEIIHALNEDNDKVDSEEDIESLGRRIDQTGNEIKDVKPISVPLPDKHTAAATRYIISKIKEIQEKLFKRTENKDLEAKLNQMATSVGKDTKVSNVSSSSVQNTTLTTAEVKNITVDNTSHTEKKEINTTKAMEGSDNVKPQGDGSKVPDRRKIIPEEVVDKILEKFQQLKQEAKHIAVSESRHSVEHAEEKGRNEEDGNNLPLPIKTYGDPKNSFKLAISSIQPYGANKSTGRIKIPLKIFRGKNEKGNHKAVIGVPILYVKNKYYLVPAYGALNNDQVHAYVRTLNQFAGQTGNNKSPHTNGSPPNVRHTNGSPPYVPHFTGDTGNNFHTNIKGKQTSRKSSVHFTSHDGSIVERLNRNPHPPSSEMEASAILRNNVRKKDGELCVIKKFQITTSADVSNKVSANGCGTSAIRRKDGESSLKDQVQPPGSHLHRRNGNRSNAENTSKKSTGPNNAMMNDNQHSRMKRQNRFMNPQFMAATARKKYMQFGKSLPSMEGITSTTQNLVNKLIDSPDLPSVAEEIRLARSKAELNAMHSIQHNMATVMPKTVIGDRRTFFNLNGFPQTEQSQGYQTRDQLSGREEPIRNLQGGENAFQTLGESKNLENSLNNFLQGNKKRNSDTISESNARQRSLQNYNDESSFRSNDGAFSMSPPISDTNSFTSEENTYNTQESSFDHNNNNNNNNLPYDEPDRPLPYKKGLQDMEEMDQPYSKNSEETTPSAINFGMQQNLASTSPPEGVSMLDDNSAYNHPPNNGADFDSDSEYNMPYGSHGEHGGQRESHGYGNSPNTNIEENISQLSQHALNVAGIDMQRDNTKENNVYDTPIGNPFAQSADISHDPRPNNPNTDNDLYKESLRTAPFESELTRGRFPDNSELTNELNIGNPSVNTKSNSLYTGDLDNKFMRNQHHHPYPHFEQGDPKLSENIDRIQQETSRMEKEYQMLTDNVRNKYGNSIPQYRRQNQIGNHAKQSPVELLNTNQNNPLLNFKSNDFTSQNGAMENNADISELLREKQLFEINKFAGKDDLSVIPNTDPLLEKSPDQLLDYARQNAIHHSLKFNTQLYGIGMPNLNEGDNSFRSPSGIPTSNVRASNMDNTGLNLMSDGIKPLVNSGRPDYSDNLGNPESNYRNPAEYFANMLNKGNEGRPFRNQLDLNINALRQYNRAKSGEQLARLHGKIPYDVDPSLADEFRSKDLIPQYNDFNNDYMTTAGDEIGNRKYPPGSLAAVSVGDLSSVSVIPSNVEGYNQGVPPINPVSFIRRFYQSQNPYNRNKIPRPGENMTLWNITASNATSANMTDLLKYIFNMVPSQNSNMTSGNESTYQFDEVEKQFDEVVKQMKNYYEENNGSMNQLGRSNTSTYNTSSEELRRMALLLFGDNGDNATRPKTANISNTKPSYNQKIRQIHSPILLQQELSHAAGRNKTVRRTSDINASVTNGNKRQVIRD